MTGSVRNGGQKKALKYHLDGVNTNFCEKKEQSLRGRKCIQF